MQPTKRIQMAVFLTVFVDLLGFGILIPILPLYAQSLATHPSAWMGRVNDFLNLQSPPAFWVGVAFVSFSLMQFVAAPILGRISDLVGRRPVLWISLMGSAVGYVMLAMTHRFEWVLAARVLDGITGGNISVAQAAMADITKPEERSKTLGMIGAAFGLGFVLGPFIGGVLSGSSLGRWLMATHGWQLPFLVAAGMSLLASILVLAWLPETLPALARTHARTVERRGHALARALKRNGMPMLLGVALAAMSGFAMMEGTYSLLAYHRFGLGQREVGYLFGFVGVLIVIYQGGLVRIVAKRIPDRIAQVAGLILMAAFLPLLAYAPWKWPFILVMVPLAWGSGMNNTATSALASQLTPPDEQGGLFGVINAVQGVGRILGPALGAFVFARWGYDATYWVAAAAVGIGIPLALMLPKHEPVVELEEA
jgi:DHA1 family tetracycline resistance protein-like MFS transporter